jgi:hypothetical protein
MHSTADQPQERLLSGLDDRTNAHLAAVRTRGEDEAGELRAKADGDVAEIQAWSEAEIQRVKDEAARRVAARREALDQELAHHDSLVTGELEGVRSAVEQHKAELADYFSRLKGATEPTTIARLAGTVPVAPDLTAVGSAARAALVSVPAAEPQAAEGSQAAEEAQPAEASEDAPPIADAYAEATDQPPADAEAAPQAMADGSSTEPADADADADAVSVDPISPEASEAVADPETWSAEAAAEPPAAADGTAPTDLTAEAMAMASDAPGASDAVAQVSGLAEEADHPEALAVTAEGAVAAADDQLAEPAAAAAAEMQPDDSTVSVERLMGVMDPQAAADDAPTRLPPWAVRLDEVEDQAAATAELATPDAVASEPPGGQAVTAAEAQAAEAVTAAAQEAPEAVGAAAGESSHGLLGSIPVLRPVGSWWSRANGNGAHEDDHTHS